VSGADNPRVPEGAVEHLLNVTCNTWRSRCSRRSARPGFLRQTSRRELQGLFYKTDLFGASGAVYLFRKFLELVENGPQRASAREPIPIKACQTISQPGSYELANNLTSSGDCLVIAANFVTIDLAGFFNQPRSFRIGVF
jgi:hypothetical protein